MVMVDGGHTPAYADGSGYNWTQTISACIITIPIKADTTKADIDVKLTDDTAEVTVQSELRFKGRLFASIKKKDCVWHLEAFTQDSKALAAPPQEPHRYKLLTLHIQKSTKGHVWGLPVLGGIANDSDADPHSLFLIASARHDSSDSSSLRRMIAAGEAGSVAAMLKLAAWYELGKEEMDVIPVSRNPAVSLDWHRRAALAGNPEACYIVMTAFASGSHGCKKSYSEALEWARASMIAGGGDDLFRKEQEALFVTVAFQAGLMLMEGGHGLGDPSPAAAAELWKLAAEVGHGQSCWNLGIFHLNGFGVEVDVKRGVELIRIGMKAVQSLKLPPQLEGLSDKDIDTVAALAEAEKKEGRKVDVEKIIKSVKSGKTTTGKKAGKSSGGNSSGTRKKSPTNASATGHEDASEIVRDDPREFMRRSVAIAAVVAGLCGIYVALSKA
ncbi:hypothetical protein HDU67_010123 [Dinochytrium kinnereticum]|nr:hypothetical protein HDU67_010123 [Dinochytrium kinnereticum]